MNNARAFRGFRFPAEVILWPDTLGVPTEQISIRWGDTNLPMAGPVYGSSHTMGAGSAVKLAAADARHKLAVYGAAPEEPLDLATLMARANVEESSATAGSRCRAMCRRASTAPALWTLGKLPSCPLWPVCHARGRRRNPTRSHHMLQCSKMVALGSPAAASRGNALRWSWAPRLGPFPRRLASLINLAGPSGPALFQARPPPMGLPLAKLRQVPPLLRAALKVRHITTCDQLLAAAGPLRGPGRSGPRRPDRPGPADRPGPPGRPRAGKGGRLGLRPDARGSGDRRCRHLGPAAARPAARAAASLQPDPQAVPSCAHGRGSRELDRPGAPAARTGHLPAPAAGSEALAGTVGMLRECTLFSFLSICCSLKARACLHDGRSAHASRLTTPEAPRTSSVPRGSSPPAPARVRSRANA